MPGRASSRANELIQIRVTLEEKLYYQQLAKARGVTLTDLIKQSISDSQQLRWRKK